MDRPSHWKSLHKKYFFDRLCSSRAATVTSEPQSFAVGYRTMSPLLVVLLLAVCCTPCTAHHSHLSFAALFVWSGYDLDDLLAVICR